MRWAGNDSGQDLLEYALLAGLIGLAALVGMSALGKSVSPKFSTIDDPVAAFVRDHMRPATAAFFSPSPLHREEPSEVVLEISPPSVSPSELERELREHAAEPGMSAAASIQVSNRMVAALVADREAVITPKDPLDRAVAPGQPVKWRWNVTPMAGSSLTLTASLRAPMKVSDGDTEYELTSFERTVTVAVTRRQRVGDVAKVARDNWMMLAAAATGVAWVVRVVVRRRSKTPAADRPDTPSTPLGV